MKEVLKEFCRSIGIEHIGITPPGPYHELEERWKKRIEEGHITGFEERDFARRIDPRLTMEDAASIIVCLFPYFTGTNKDSNLSKSAIPRDYHLIVKSMLNQIGEFLQNRIVGFQYKAFVDNGPLVDRYLAYQAGLGYWGVNAHLITDAYGSYVFIGYLITNHPFPWDKPMERTCIQCGKCVKACPGCAILGNFDINPLRCRSFITQKKGELSEADITILKRSSLVFGCDICQDVCPHNRGIECTPMEDFQRDLKHNIDYEELLEISNKEFLRRYRDRAFSWRGKSMLLRNFELLKKGDNNYEGCE